MKIPFSVSSPTSLSPSQEATRTVIIRQLDDNDLEARALGRSDYPTELPLREVLLIARHCSGGIILGFEQFRASGGLKSPELLRKSRLAHQFHFRRLGTIWSQAFFSGFMYPFWCSANKALQEVYSIPALQMFSFILCRHQTSNRCEGCSEAGISEMGGQGSRALL